MRMMTQIVIPVESGNEAARTGAFGPSFQKMLEPLKPEAAYQDFLALWKDVDSDIPISSVSKSE
jgi:hypothetical protein